MGYGACDLLNGSCERRSLDIGDAAVDNAEAAVNDAGDLLVGNGTDEQPGKEAGE